MKHVWDWFIMHCVTQWPTPTKLSYFIYLYISFFFFFHNNVFCIYKNDIKYTFGWIEIDSSFKPQNIAEEKGSEADEKA